MQLGTYMLFLLSVASSLQDDDFCDTNLNNSTESPSFTKRLNSELYALENMYKDLPCCARNYDYILWFKDNVTLSEEHSSFLRNKHVNNQIIESRFVQKTDAGVYRCEVWNKTNPIPLVLNINLSVERTSNYKGRPKAVTNTDDVYVMEGESANFSVTVVVGDNKDVRDIYWSKNRHGFLKNNSRITMTTIERDTGIVQIVLQINYVIDEDYGDYICHIDNGSPPPLEIKRSLILGDRRKVVNSYKFAFVIVGIFVVSFFIIMSTVNKWSLEMRLLWKDRFGKSEENDDKEYDVFVCYDPEDANFTLEVLVPTLENVYKYRCFAYERDSLAGEWIPETYTSGVRASRRFLMVLSRALATNNWCIYALYVAIEAMLNLHSKIICIQLEEIPWEEITAGNTSNNDTILRQVLSVVKKVKWEGGPTVEIDETNNQSSYGHGTLRFWKKLRLHLPPRRQPHHSLSSESQESLIVDYASS